MLYTYRVETVCAATIREVWTVQSSVPLSHGMLAQAFAAPGGPGPDVTCVEEATSVTEGERVVCGVHAPGIALARQH
jgi:hypothetical protein